MNNIRPIRQNTAIGFDKLREEVIISRDHLLWLEFLREVTNLQNEEIAALKTRVEALENP